MSTSNPPDASTAQVVLSINFNHDGAAVLLVEGRIAGFVCTERFSRKKKHPGLRDSDLDELLDQAGIQLADVDHVMLCNLHNMDSPDIPKLHGSDLKDTWFEFWVNHRNDRVSIRDQVIPCTVNPDHHLIHAACAYYTSPFDSAATLAIDPTGCRAFVGQGNRLVEIERKYDDWFNANIGYTLTGIELFGSGVIGAGKVMALAPFGRPQADAGTLDWKAVTSFQHLLSITSENPIHVQVGDRQLNATLAYYVQLGLELQLDAVLEDLAVVCQRNGLAPHLCMSGGTSLNAIANQLCFTRSTFERLHLHPACGDDGTALGAALWHWHHVLGRPRQPYGNADLMYSVRRYDTPLVEAALTAAGRGRLVVTRTDDHAGRVAELLAEGATVGWFDGASEIGPRALGHRTILADPRDPAMRDRLNATVKFREHFRPFAPAVLNEHAVEWFDLADSPFMLRACPVLRPADVPAITHVDGTSRIQTVARSDSPAFYDVISRFRDRTGVPLLLSTSLNTKGLPIDETPADAVSTLLESGLDYLAFPGLVVGKPGAAAG